jgi:hypothetical protein
MQQADTSDRRASPRFTALDHRGWLGQWSDQGFAVFEVRVLDIGKGGAAIEMDERPIGDRPVLLGLETLREACCLEAAVVRIRRGRRSRYRVHLAFAEPCNEEFFAAVIHAGRGVEREHEHEPCRVPVT